MLRRFARAALVALLFSTLASAARADGAAPDPGHLRQTVLVILRFPPEGVTDELTAAEEAHISQQLQAASDFIWTNSNQSLKVDFHPVKMLETLTIDDYWISGSGSGAAAKYTAALHDSLQRRHIDPDDYAGVVMIYWPTSAPAGTFSGFSWTYYNVLISSTPHNPGFSSVVFNSSSLLGEVTVHEYLHQLDDRFRLESGNPEPGTHGFQNPDDMNNAPGQHLAQLLNTTFSQPVDYYKAMLKFYVGADNQLHPVNYRWLEGTRGAFYGGEAKQVYDFGRTDDRLIHAGGDDNSVVVIESPDSFWFRALPGHTAAFRTQTAYGRYILKSLTFNYEIAPLDYSFQVWLVYFDNSGHTVRQRIDDGIYNLGRQQFKTNHKTVLLNREVEDFQILFQKGNEIVGRGASDDWALLGDIKLDLVPAP